MYYYLPIILTIVANIIYHITQRYTSEKVSPFFSLSITYLIALIVSIVLYVTTRKDVSVIEELKLVNAATPILGFSIVFLELGFLLAYRCGWNIGTASIISTIMVTLLLVPIGIFVFRESISLKNMTGIILCIIGMVFMNLK